MVFISCLPNCDLMIARKTNRNQTWANNPSLPTTRKVSTHTLACHTVSWYNTWFMITTTCASIQHIYNKHCWHEEVGESVLLFCFYRFFDFWLIAKIDENLNFRLVGKSFVDLTQSNRGWKGHTNLKKTSWTNARVKLHFQVHLGL